MAITAANESGSPAGAGVAVLVLDMLSTYDHEDADRLAASAENAVPAVAELVEAARRAAVPVIYVNDNHGRWSPSAAELAEVAAGGRRPDLVRPLTPAGDDMLVVKARHSAFYMTPLEYLLARLGTRRVVLCGQVTEQCVLYTALDAYVRHLEVTVAADAVAHIDERLAGAALEMIARNMSGDVRRTGEIRLAPPIAAAERLDQDQTIR